MKKDLELDRKRIRNFDFVLRKYNDGEIISNYREIRGRRFMPEIESER